MIYLFTFYRQKLIVALMFAVLLLWAMSVSVWAMKQKPQTLVVALSPDGAKLVTDKNDRPSEIMTENFIHRFIALAFNYTNATYEENLNLATDLMTDELFEKQRDELKRVSLALKGRYLEQSATISSIKRLEPGRFEIMVKTNQVLDRRNETFDTRVRIKVQPTERTTRNPWGMEVSEYVYERP